MALTTADLLIERLIDVGRGHDLRPARRRHQRDLRGAAHAPGPNPLHPGPARGGRGLRRLRLRQVHRPPGRLPGDLGPRRHPPAERPLRRQAGQPAGAGHHRPHLPRPDRRALPAGRRSRQALHGRRRLQRARHGPGSRRQHGRRRHQARARASRRGPPDHPQGHPGLDQPRTTERSKANIPRHSGGDIAGCRTPMPDAARSCAAPPRS